MKNCVNFNSPDVVKLAGELNVSPAVAAAKIGLWQSKNNIEDRFPTKDELFQSNEVNTTLKAVDILQSDKAKQVFEKGNKNGWDLNKILTELQIPKEQKQLILDLGVTDREQIALELASNYSYSVKIDITKENIRSGVKEIEEDNYDTLYSPSENKYYSYSEELGWMQTDENNRNQEFDINPPEDAKPYQKNTRFEDNYVELNSSHYSNLTVPGGTNYTENEISTPLITPSIKGHAQFATDNGIGWFRSDDALVNNGLTQQELDNIPQEYLEESLHNTKTRRILEVQSDLFQKGRDKEWLSREMDSLTPEEVANEPEWLRPIGTIVKSDSKKNAFLNLLIKDNNWVTFFVKSIIQDSQKKGYEKVLFPSGDTASKVEGHSTLEEFKKQKEDRIKELEKRKKEGTETVERYLLDDNNEPYSSVNVKIDEEINQLKQELERVETEGFGALKPIYNFYENTVTNILNKTYGKDNVKVITDEYGNTWNEVTLDNKRDESTIFMKQVDMSNIIDDSVETIFPDTKSETIEQSDDNQNHKLLFGDENIKTLSATEVLKNLISSDTFNNSKDEGFFLEKMMNLLNKSGAKLKLITDVNDINYQKFDSKTVMLYDAITNTIYVNDTSLNNFDKQTLASAFIHEVVHSTTLRAYFAPRTFEEREFRDFIDKSFFQYKYLSEKRDSEGNLMYGFTNQAEFIAEIYSNPAFRAEIESIDKKWFDKFIDAVRRLYEMIKNGFNTDLIKSAVLFNIVDEFATKQSVNYKGTLVKDPRFERFGKSEFAKKVEGDKIRNLDERLENLINIQKDNISQIIRRAQSNNKKHGVKNKEFINVVKKLEEELHTAAQTDKLKAINTYVDFMVYQIDKIKNLMEKSTNKTETLDIIERYKTYLGASDLLKPVTDTLVDTDIKDLSEEQQLYNKEILRKIGEVGGYYNILQAEFTAHINKELINELNDPYYSEIVIQEFRNTIGKDYPKDSELSKNEWINQEVVKRQDELDKLIEEDKNQLIKGVSADIDKGDANIFSILDTKSRFMQIGWKLITKMQSKINELIRNYDFKLDKLNTDLKNEKGKYDVKNLFEKDSNGQTFIKGEYNLKFRDKYINEYSKLLDESVQLRKKLTAEGLSTIQIHSNAELKVIFSKLAKWRAENTKTIKGVIYPADKYKNVLNFSKAEKAIYDEYLKLVHEGVKQFGKDNSLLRSSLNANYYMIPYQTISNLERLKEGKLNVVDFAKQKYTDIVDWKIDEIENTKKMFTPLGKEIHRVPVLYRNNITKSEDEKEFNKRLAEQSVDLLTLMRLEFHNLTNHSQKTQHETVLNALVDTAKSKNYTKTDSNGGYISNVFGKNKKTVTLEGSDSNTYKRLESIVNQTLYNQFNEASIKILGKDMSKLSKSLISHTAFLGMTANYFSAPVNILNAEFQQFILKIGGDIKNGALSSAHKFYFADMPNILNDVGRPVNHSVTNQLNEIFDIFGGLTSVQQDFVKNTILKSIIDPQMLQIMQSGGEHMIQSILNIALMKSVKVMNSESKYIDKTGKIVKEENAATLFDMINQDKNTKQVSFSDNFTYTSLSTNTKWNNGGFENVKLYIKKKVSDTMGQHDKNYQSEYQKHWWGQLLSMYRKHVVPLGIARYRGAGKMFVNKLDLSEEDLHWNEFLQINEEGYYTTFGRMFLGGFNKGIVNGLQNLKYSVLKVKWNELSNYEKSNIKKATAEFSTLALLNFVIIPLLAGLGGDGDDDDYLVYLLMESRRLEQELGSYTDPNDAYKITKSPTATLSLINNSISVGKFVVSPTSWFSTNEKGELRFLNALEKVTIPSALRPDTTAKTALKQMDQGLSVPYNETIFYKLFNENN